MGLSSPHMVPNMSLARTEVSLGLCEPVTSVPPRVELSRGGGWLVDSWPLALSFLFIF